MATRQNHGVGPNGESQINSPRRAVLLESFAQDRVGDEGHAAVLRWNHANNFGAGTPIPLTTPAYAKLVAAHYTAVEDFDGASADELIANIPTLTRTEANAVIAALGT